MDKMSLDEFRRIKNRLLEIVNLDTREITEEETEELTKELFGLMDQLTQYDLSDIPFEEWEGMYLFSEGKLDMSKTHANLDFALIKGIEFETANFKGCNIKNLNEKSYDEDYFDPEFVESHPEFFPDKALPEEVRKKFYKHKITFQDILDYPSLKKCISINSFAGTSRKIVNLIGLEYSLKMLEEYPLLMVAIVKDNEDSFIDEFHFDKEIVFDGGSYEDAKEVIFKNIIYNLESYGRDILKEKDLIPEEMKKKHPEVFFGEETASETICDEFVKGTLSISEIRYNYDALKTKKIEVGYRRNHNLGNLIELFGSLEEIINNLPAELDAPMIKLMDWGWWEKKDQIKELFENDREELYRRAIRLYINGNETYYLSDIRDYSKYLPLKSLISDEKIEAFINHFGFDNIIKFNDKYDFIFEKTSYNYFNTNYSNTFLGLVANQDLVPYDNLPKTYEGLEEFVNNVIEFARSYENHKNEFSIKVMDYRNILAKIMPNKFVDYSIVEDQLKELNSYTRSSVEKKLNDVLSGDFKAFFEILKEFPKMMVLFEDKQIEFKDKPIFNELINILGMKKFLELCKNYFEVIEYTINNVEFDNIMNAIMQPIYDGVDPESAFNQYVYSTLGKSNRRICDLEELPKSFKDTYPDLFLPDSSLVPEELKIRFTGYYYSYSYSMLTLIDLRTHPEWIPFLDNLDLSRCMEPLKICLINSERVDVGSYNYSNDGEIINLYGYLKQYMSNREMLEFLSRYANCLKYDRIIGIPHNEIKGNNIKEVFDSVIYRNAVAGRYSISVGLVDKEFIEKHPDLFLDDGAPEQLQNLFYQKKLDIEVLRDYPEWDEYLQGKSLYTFLERNISYFAKKMLNNGLNNKEILYLIRKYGKYLVDDRTYAIKGSNLEEIEKKIRETLVSMIKMGSNYGEDAFQLVGDLFPEAFLDPSAPQELKDAFYYQNKALTFDLLKQHKEWLDFLEGKLVLQSLAKAGYKSYGLSNLLKNLSGVRELLLLGMKNPEAVAYMITHRKEDLLLKWYKKVKFIPHYAVMTEFPFEEADKFMASGKLWSQIMRIEDYNDSFENITSMLKVAYVFGVFDGDAEGFTKFMQLFNNLPEMINEEEYNKMIDKAIAFGNEAEKEVEKAYRPGENGFYYLQIDPQRDRKTAMIVKKMAIAAQVSGMLTPNLAHQLFGSFSMIYDSTFRDFFMENFDEIIDSGEDYISYMSSIQKAWTRIRATNSNRVLTLELAKDFVISNKYENVEVGNEVLAQVVSESGYSQEDFEKLQEIYNYGKSRVHSSIPRITASDEIYEYEILRLDDPIALVIGPLTNCCQKLGDAAETTMEHSMVSEHGRVFVVRDRNNNIEAQSWVWRNGNVLCFDNIEIPNKAFRRAELRGLTREQYADEILAIYQKAAQEIIEIDNERYKELLDAGRITEEQYEALRMKKVTVGAGYNDIKESLDRNTSVDKQRLARPLRFHPPVHLTEPLYTNDSQKTQYILAGDENATPNKEVETITAYDDEFRIIDDTTMNKTILKSMAKLDEAVREGYSEFNYYPENHVMASIARTYNLDPYTTKVVYHPNFFIVYCISDDKVVIADIVRNVKINTHVQERDITDIVNIQIGLALKQIKEDMEFDVEMLDSNELEIFNQALASAKIDSERSFSHGI